MNEVQAQARSEFASFVRTQVAPYADDWDRREAIPADLVTELASRGYLGAVVPKEYAGSDLDEITFGLLSEALGGGCAADP